MLKNLLLITALVTASFALTAEEFQKQQMQGFNSYKKSQEEGFKAYQKAQMKAFEDYKKEIGTVWEKPKLSTKKEWVAYTPDKKTRTDVDFEHENITVETIAKSPEEAAQKLKIALAKAVTVDTKTVQDTDPLEKRLKKIKKPEGVVDGKVKAEPILAPVIFQKPPTKQSVKKYIHLNISNRTIQKKKSPKVKNAFVYSVVVQMPKDAMLKRSKVYEQKVRKHAKKQELPVELVFAIMQTESAFNPRARSHIPAYGLMQIVPRTAGIDTYNYLYHEKKLVTGAYLYDSTNNITMGSAYLHILYYRYLKKIKNPTSRLYCTIAAYNTGAGNIAWAFTKKYNMTKAAPLINALTPKQVYNRLLKDLRFDEPKHYLKRVTKRMSAYHKVYGS